MDERLAFYALPGDFGLAQSPCFRSGRVYGQDVSSGAAVAALLSDRYDATKEVAAALTAPETGVTLTSCEEFRVLDMCCSPGLKLCAIADWLSTAAIDKNRSSVWHSSTVVAVDISESRTALCKRIVAKYQLDPSTCGDAIDATSKSPVQDDSGTRIRLYCNDGTTFGQHEEALNLIFDSTASAEEFRFQGKRKRMNKSARGRERKRLKQLAQVDQIPEKEMPTSKVAIQLFDRVLVDAECSTDGSLKHVQQRLLKKESKMQKDESPSNPQLIPQLTDDQQLADLVRLQQRLAASGFRLLKPGGYMIYSTCSLSEEQNEGVVSWLLKHHLDARIVPLSFTSNIPDNSDLVKEGTLPGTVRFLPNTDIHPENMSLLPSVDTRRLFGGGFFLAKIEKTAA